MTNTRPVDFDDMQALLRFGHGHLPYSRFLLLTITDRPRAARWLRRVPVTSAARQDRLPKEAIHLAFTAQGLRRLGLSQEALHQFADAFISGMSGDENRSRRLGDVGHNAPSHWYWGHRDQDRLHLILLIYARHEEIESSCTSLLDEDFNAGFTIVKELPTDRLTAIEPFGFVDGISQPSIDWQQTQDTDVHARDAFSNLLAPGEIVLGYPDEYAQCGQRPLLPSTHQDPENLLPVASENPAVHDLGINGSYLVLRQLEQHVDAFWEFVRGHSGNDEQAAETLAASLVGRRRNGEPLVTARNVSIPGIANSRLNSFDYDQDSDGQQCPIGAHVRRSNPRTGDLPPGSRSLWNRLWRLLGFKRQHLHEDLIASTRFHRLLRRGRTYGLAASRDEPRGLHFISIGSNLVRQFEFVQAAWCVSSAFGGTYGERDPLIAHRQPREDGSSTANFRLPDSAGPARVLPNLPHFVTVRGGAYFFLPGIRAIRYLAWCASGESAAMADTEGVTGRHEAGASVQATSSDAKRKPDSPRNTA